MRSSFKKQCFIIFLQEALGIMAPAFKALDSENKSVFREKFSLILIFSL